jgi:polyisoprenoid-binding protein YceI
MEDIEGHNNQVVSIFDLSTGDLMYNLLVKAFDFKIALMQEHFNENYMESDQFPKATFKGKVNNFEKIDLNKDGTYTAEVIGDITIHGVTKPIINTGTIEVKGGLVSTKAKFNISPKDYNIIIPSLVENKIAKEVEVTIDVTYNSN